MIYKPKNSRYLRTKFMWKGKPINRPTRCTNRKDARAVEAKIRTELALGNYGILEPQEAPTLAEFFKSEFVPYIKSKHKEKENTVEYYDFGVKMLSDSKLGKLKLDEITDQHAQQFVAHRSAVGGTRKGRKGNAVSTINCALRTLRRALKVAEEWGKIDRAAKITLAKGERQRDRVLTKEEETAYLDFCPQPWRDVATVMLGTGNRPGEVLTQRLENILLNEASGVIQVVDGKSKAARRLLPMTTAVHEVYSRRLKLNGGVQRGWAFPADSESGHLTQGTTKGQHDRALKTLEKATSSYREWEKENNGQQWWENVSERTGIDQRLLQRHAGTITKGLKRFEPYCLRHTALTRLAEACGDNPFALAQIAGHSSITITQRYCHPQAETIERAFAKMSQIEGLVIEGGNSNIPALPEPPNTGTANLEVSMGCMAGPERFELPTY